MKQAHNAGVGWPAQSRPAIHHKRRIATAGLVVGVLGGAAVVAQMPNSLPSVPLGKAAVFKVAEKQSDEKYLPLPKQADSAAKGAPIIDEFFEAPTLVTFDAPANATVVHTGFFYHPLTPEIINRITGNSFHANDVINYDDLRYVQVRHYDFNGEVQTGELIVNQAIADDVTNIFHELYLEQYPIEKMVLIDNYGGDDDLSMADNNTSAFNFRVISGTSSLSNHAYGMAIDINPRINPWVTSWGVFPANGVEYAQRNPESCSGEHCDLMIQSGDVIYRIFAKYGFTWGGSWSDSKDYQHFEKR